MRFGKAAVVCAAALLMTSSALARTGSARMPASSGGAVSKQARGELSLAIKAYKAGKIDEALGRAVLAERSADKDQVALSKALELQGVIHARKKDAPGAENAYLKLVIALDVKHKYHSIGPYAEFDAALKRDQEAGRSARPHEKTLEAYFKLGNISRKTGNRELAIRSFRVAHAHGHKSGQSRDALAALGATPPEARSSRTAGKLHFNVAASFWMLTDNLTILRGTDELIPLTYSSMGPCLGAGISYGLSGSLELGLDACGMFGKGDMSEDDAALDYSPRDVALMGAIVSPGIHWYPFRAPLTLGLEIPVLLRQIDAPDLPPASNSALSLPVFDFGGALALKYRFGGLALALRGGYSPGFSTVLMGAQLSYQF